MRLILIPRPGQILCTCLPKTKTSLRKQTCRGGEQLATNHVPPLVIILETCKGFFVEADDRLGNALDTFEKRIYKIICFSLLLARLE